MCPCFGRDKSHEPQVSGLLPDEETGRGPDFGYALNQNARSYVEDAVSMCHDVGGYRMFAILDAHAGKEAVVASQNREVCRRALEVFYGAAWACRLAFWGAFKEVDDKTCEKLRKGADA